MGCAWDVYKMSVETPAYAAHFSEMYFNKGEGATMTGERIRLLMLALPFVLRDLIAPE